MIQVWGKDTVGSRVLTRYDPIFLDWVKEIIPVETSRPGSVETSRIIPPESGNKSDVTFRYGRNGSSVKE